MTPYRPEKSPELVKKGKKRFEIVKLEERIAPSHHSTTTSVDTVGPPRGGESGTLSGGTYSVQSRG